MLLRQVVIKKIFLYEYKAFDKKCNYSYYKLKKTFSIYSYNGTRKIDTSPTQANSKPISPGAKIYMYCDITSNRYVRVRVVDQADFSNVYADFSNVYYDVFIWQDGKTTPANSDIYKQVTMAQHSGENNGTVMTNTGTQMLNAKIWDSYLYSNSETVKWNPYNVWQILRASQTYDKAANTVQVSTVEKWSAESVSIIFNY